MKILHTADWHFGIDLHKVSLFEDQKYFIDQLISIVESEQVDLILVAGDIYDTTLASKEAIELYNTVMTTLCLKLKKQVVVIAGNHDSPTRLASCAKLLGPMGLHVIGKIEDKIEGIAFDDVRIYPIPFFHIDTIRNVYEQPIENEQQAFEAIVSHIETHKEVGCTHIAMAHTFMAGASVCESDRFAHVGGSDLLNSAVFDTFDYIALGHLHRFQKVGKNAYYCGSPIAYSFSETNQTKKVILYDTKIREVKDIELKPLHKLQVLKGSFEALKKGIQEPSRDVDTYLKIEVEDAVVTYEMLEYFRQKYDAVLQLSGKSNVQNNTSMSLQLEDLDKTQDLDIVKQFFHDYYKEELSVEEIKLFQEACEASEGEDEECVH